DNPIFSRFSAVSLTNSNLKSVVTGDCINVKKGYARVENCEFEGGFEPDMDAIDYDGVVGGIVRNNVIHGFRGDNCDGLDIGEACENLLIENNLIFHCFDKGISVGQQSSATIRNNTIAYTSYGIALKDQSPVIIDHCTLYGNQKGIAAYEKNPGHLGGIGVVSNCIVSNALLFSYEADTYSELDIIHCISDPDTVSGTGNLSADPRFVDPERYNFLLTPGSPAISAGINGVNIGAESTLAFTIQPELMIAEILYNDTLSTKGEFIEILNDGLLSVNLNGYTLANAIDFRFPSGAIIAPGERIVVAEDATQFGGNIQVFEWTDGKLKNEGESILLYDGAGLLVDWVRYDNHAPWPESSELNGKSIELRGPQLDNHLATSWQASNGVGGTPGFDPAHVGVYAPQNQVQFEVSPNPNNGVFYIDVKDYTSVSVRVCDLSGKIILPDRQVVSGHPVQLEVLAPGSYLLYLTNKHLNLPFVKLIQVIP
ncbi:MAG: lamin tail domain-containing protein, partial [Saprospiraceae bacterium]|nr:lamin tail domain-containing protein [Saprospiraceae bacterium]